MPVDHKSIVWSSEVNKSDVGVVGGKGANLSEMTNARIPIQPGFIVSASAYFGFLRENNIEAHTFKLELAAIKKVRQEYNNLWVMVPFVRTPAELAKTVGIMAEEGLKRAPDFSCG